jgi:hypothetical protein
LLFEVGKPANAVVKDGGRKGGIGVSFAEDIDEMLRATCAAGSDDGYAN